MNTKIKKNESRYSTSSSSTIITAQLYKLSCSFLYSFYKMEIRGKKSRNLGSKPPKIQSIVFYSLIGPMDQLTISASTAIALSSEE